MKQFSLLLTFLIVLFFMPGCDVSEDDSPSGNWANSVFIVNEGPFQSGSGTISAFNRESGKVTHDLFESVNGRPLGNIVQSMTIHDGRAFIVVHKANKIEVVDPEDFKSVASIEGIELPRYFLGLNEEKGYVSCWDSTVKVIDLTDFSVAGSIPAGAGPDKMLLAGDKLFVTNSGGLVGVDHTLTVINTVTDQPVKTINVGDRPVGLQMDKSGTIWVLCSGQGWNGFPDPSDTRASLIRLLPATYEIIDDVLFNDTDNHPDNLTINETGSVLYYNHPEGIFSFSIAMGALNPEPLVHSGKMFYGLGFDLKDSLLYAADPLDYAQDGWIFRFDAYSGEKVDSIPARIVPNGFCFN
jgi:YVTN family beta-propeller protein